MTISVWGIVNATPDSFSDAGRYASVEAAVTRGHELIAHGADVLDLGGESTRPGAQPVTTDEELRRVLPVVRELAGAVKISVDTYHAATAAAVLEVGAEVINDVAGGLAEPDILRVVAEHDAEYVLGHWRGPSTDMYAGATYAAIERDVAAELTVRVDAAIAAGICPERIILDPGLGFAKRGQQNWDALANLNTITDLGYRVLVGTSRKGFLKATLARADGADEVGEARLDLATAVTSVLAAHRGAWGVRVHNVRATTDALATAAAWAGAE